MEAPDRLLPRSHSATSPHQRDALSRYLRLAAREGMRGDAALRRLQSPDIRFLELRRLDHLLRRQAPYFGQEIQVRRTAWRGRIERLIKMLMRKVLRSYASPQIEFNEAAAQALGECLEHLTELDRQVTTLRNQRGHLGAGGSRPAIESGDERIDRPAVRPE